MQTISRATHQRKAIENSLLANDDASRSNQNKGRVGNTFAKVDLTPGPVAPPQSLPLLCSRICIYAFEFTQLIDLLPAE
jgi:hypothetical protein